MKKRRLSIPILKPARHHKPCNACEVTEGEYYSQIDTTHTKLGTVIVYCVKCAPKYMRRFRKNEQ